MTVAMLLLVLGSCLGRWTPSKPARKLARQGSMSDFLVACGGTSKGPVTEIERLERWDEGCLYTCYMPSPADITHAKCNAQRERGVPKASLLLAPRSTVFGILLCT